MVGDTCNEECGSIGKPIYQLNIEGITQQFQANLPPKGKPPRTLLKYLVDPRLVGL